ncbi:MAG: energy-coupling factor ABC transporter permease, partial [Nitrospirota bacterium]
MKRATSISILAAAILLFSARSARAMHISEGILPFHWAALWFAAAVPFVAYGLWRLKVLSRTD